MLQKHNSKLSEFTVTLLDLKVDSQLFVVVQLQ